MIKKEPEPNLHRIYESMYIKLDKMNDKPLLNNNDGVQSFIFP